jgi:tetratricopeptide (TPR) repeat protein
MKKIVFAILVALMCGFSAMAQNNPLRDSLAAATKLMEEYPDSVDLRLKKAGWNMMLQQWQYAKDEYDHVLQREPTNVAALFYRAYANEKLSRYNFARLDYQHFLTLVPGNFEAQLGLALLNQKDHHYTEAYDGINRLVNAYPDSAVAYAARGGIEKERKMLERAAADYEHAWKLDSHTIDYLINLADIRIMLGQMELARENLRQLERLGYPRKSLESFYSRLR